ncbi:putative ankyrin repeat protein RF_0381 [Physella acuta]|uniref:putative ankyrin repeat protein RF_0381 n=1 Tax=Physella acuta TaxID=109671 RepID=UPI0027DDF804|nr:putative ankyrin repeat protein RF_0381 [Physella acuta]
MEASTCSFNRQSSDVIEKLFKAAQTGSKINDKEINAKNREGYTALMLAVERENLQVLRALLEAGADVNVSRSSDGSYTALSLAVDKGHTTAVRELLQHGAFLSCEKGIEALDMARENGFFRAVVNGEEYLIRQNKEQTLNENTGVFQSFKNNRLDLVKDLITAGSYIDKTALTLAISKNSPPCVDILIESKIDVNFINKNKWTPLHMAASKNEQIVGLLIKGKADVNAKTCEGETSLHLAASTGDIKTIQRLKEAGGLVDSQDKNGDSV